MVAGALVALVVAAVTSLALPIAVRRVIDHGFDQIDRGLIDSYFIAIMAMALLLAAASALRY
jgi:ATP-binding cassette subfamily B protein